MEGDTAVGGMDVSWRRWTAVGPAPGMKSLRGGAGRGPKVGFSSPLVLVKVLSCSRAESSSPVRGNCCEGPVEESALFCFSFFTLAHDRHH